MNRIIRSILLFGLLLLTIVSPFAALASLMLILVAYAFIWTVWNIIAASIETPGQSSPSKK